MRPVTKGEERLASEFAITTIYWREISSEVEVTREISRIGRPGRGMDSGDWTRLHFLKEMELTRHRSRIVRCNESSADFNLFVLSLCAYRAPRSIGRVVPSTCYTHLSTPASCPRLNSRSPRNHYSSAALLAAASAFSICRSRLKAQNIIYIPAQRHILHSSFFSDSVGLPPVRSATWASGCHVLAALLAVFIHGRSFPDLGILMKRAFIRILCDNVLVGIVYLAGRRRAGFCLRREFMPWSGLGSSFLKSPGKMPLSLLRVAAFVAVLASETLAVQEFPDCTKAPVCSTLVEKLLRHQTAANVHM